MKIKQLLEYDRRPVEPEIDHEEESGRDSLYDYIMEIGGKEIGEGLFAIVYDKPGDINTVIKHGKTFFRDGEFSDGYLKFVINLMKNRRAQDNPFLPQIYSVKLKKRHYQTYNYNVEMEKLEHLFSKEEMQDYYTIEQALTKLNKEPQSQFSQIVTMLSNLINLSQNESL